MQPKWDKPNLPTAVPPTSPHRPYRTKDHDDIPALITRVKGLIDLHIEGAKHALLAELALELQAMQISRPISHDTSNDTGMTATTTTTAVLTAAAARISELQKTHRLSFAADSPQHHQHQHQHQQHHQHRQTDGRSRARASTHEVSTPWSEGDDTEEDAGIQDVIVGQRRTSVRRVALTDDADLDEWLHALDTTSNDGMRAVRSHADLSGEYEVALEMAQSTRPTLQRGSTRESVGSVGTGILSAGIASFNKWTSVQQTISRVSDLEEVAEVVKSWQFESLCSVFIMLNCLTMGLTAQQEVTEQFSENTEFLLMVSEHVFTAIFSLECCFRIYVCGCQAYSMHTAEGRANLLDGTVVLFTGIMTTWIVPFVSHMAGVNTNSGSFRALSVLRAIRLVRLVRVVREVPIFREAWMLIRGLGGSMRTLLWTVVVVLFVTYSFAICGVLTIVVSLQELQDEDQIQASELSRLDALMNILEGVDKFMFTLVQVLTLDSFHVFIREIVHFLPWSWVFFYAYVAIACLVLMNLVTAIIVESAMEQSNQDHEQQLRDKITREEVEMRRLRALFEALDQDKSGTLSWEEFRLSFDNPLTLKKWRMLDFQPEECSELFHLLDNGDGEIDTTEFFEGLSKMRGPAQAKDLFRMSKLITMLARKIYQ